MTRINLVPVGELADQHLFAEFREIKMVPKSLARSLRAVEAMGARSHETIIHCLLQRIPPAYTLGKGHVSFFYDKGLYLQQRYSQLRHELRRRGVQFNESALLDPDCVFDLDARLRQDYSPTADALALVRKRIAERIAQKPEWYRWTESTGSSNASPS